MKKLILTLIVACVFFSIPVMGTKTEKMDKLDIYILMKRYQDAENYCMKLKETERPDAFKKVASAYLQSKNLDKAIEFCEKAKYQEGFNQLGAMYVGLNDYPKAVEFYNKGVPSIDRAITYESAADILVGKNRFDAQAKAFYDHAIEDYLYILKTIGYEWKPEYYPLLKRCYGKRESFPMSNEEKKQAALLDKVMTKTAAYCDRLNVSAFVFFCNEHLSEKIDLSRDSKISPRDSNRWQIKKTYLYEYQLIKEEDEIQEIRIQKEYDGIKMNKPDAKLENKGFYYERLIMGPLALLGRAWAPFYHYRIIREETLFNEPAVVIEAVPIQHPGKNHLFGNLWVSLTDFSVMKIEWCPKSLQESERFQKNAEYYKSKPDISFSAEFNIQKRGIRFPSRYDIEEAYIDSSGKRFVHAKQRTILSNYKFFTVGTEVINAEGETSDKPQPEPDQTAAMAEEL